MTNDYGIRPACPLLRVHYFILEEGKGQFEVSFGEDDSRFVFEGKKGSQRKTEALVPEVKLNEEQQGWSKRDVASVLLERLAETLEDPGALADFNKIVTRVESKIVEGEHLTERPQPKSGATGLRILSRHADGWMIEEEVPVHSGEGGQDSD